ncbi:MAG TPA: type II toxin-antitoxin system VapC family toxin [Candidatus Koribacter sp.]
MIVLDTQAAVWTALEPARLSKDAAAAIERRGSSEGLAISVVTLVEVAWLLRRARIEYPGTIAAFLRRLTETFRVLPITVEIAEISAQFPAEYPKDPSDRVIGATAVSMGTVLVTSDRGIRESNAVHTIW